MKDSGQTREAHQSIFTPRPVFLVFIVVGLLIFLYGIFGMAAALGSMQWPATTGKVTSAESVRNGRHHCPLIIYDYSVDGRSYEGRSIRSGLPERLLFDNSRVFIRRYPKDSLVTVYYDPDKPGRAILETGPGRELYAICLAGLFIMLLGNFFYRFFNTPDVAGVASDISDRQTDFSIDRRNRVRRGPDQPGALSGKKRRHAFSLLLVFCALIISVVYPELSSWLTEPDTAAPPVPRAGEKTTQSGPIRPEPLVPARPEANEPITPPPHAASQAHPIHLSISKTFSIFPENTSGSHSGRSITLFDSKPAELAAEPLYTGDQQKYGVMRLGNHTDNRFFLVLDFHGNEQPLLYFDRNHNHDLSDDGGPIANQGSGLFAAEITVPFEHLVKDAAFPGSYNLWFFVSSAGLRRGYANHYSRTHLIGKVELQGEQFTAYLSERQVNDADYTNDGISLDLNRDNQIDQNREFIAPDQILEFNQVTYFFIIDW